MVISKNSQLGLMMWDTPIMLAYLQDSKKTLELEKNRIDKEIKDLGEGSTSGLYDLRGDSASSGELLYKQISQRLGYNKENHGSEFYTIKHPNPYNYLIQGSVEDCAKMIRIKDNFSCVIFNKIKDGEHIYLLGKNEFYRFLKFNGVIRGSFWNKERGVSFEVGFHLEKDKYYFPQCFSEDFNRLVRLMAFIELGDIEIIVLDSGRNNGKPKSKGKLTNTSSFTVYVVDSSWNQLIIRTEGFAVMGHFRLQPYGPGMIDRKLIWINAFEKHGYKRLPKARIIHGDNL